MDIYLIRHAEAADKSDDPERHLTARGQRDAATLAQRLAPLKLRVRAIWHSGKPRAKETAEAIMSAVHSNQPELIEQGGLKPMDPVKRFARFLCEQNESIMIVGHEPFLGRLAARLVTGRASTPLLSLGKPSAVCLRREPEDGEWRVAWMLSDEVLEEPVSELPDDAASSSAAPTTEMASEAVQVI